MTKNCVLICIITSSFAQAQNLVPNPSFELYNACPTELKKGNHYLKNWTQPTDGTIDYYNRCSQSCGVPLNPMGHQDPKSGDGYIGLMLYNDKNRGYIQVELKEPLVALTNYTVEFSVCLSEKSKYAIGNIATYFTVQKIVSKTENVFETYEYIKSNGDLGLSTGLCKPQFKNGTSNFISDYSYWTTITGTFRAKGGERYLTIGNFATTEGTPALEATAPPNFKQAKKEYSYYFMDDIGVYQTGKKPEAFATIVVLPEKGIMRNEPVKITEAKINSEPKKELAVANEKKEEKKQVSEADIEAALAAADKEEEVVSKKTEVATEKSEEKKAKDEAAIEAALEQAETVKAKESVKQNSATAEEIEAALAAADKKPEVIKQNPEQAEVKNEKVIEAALAATEKKDAQLEAAATESAVETALQRKTPKQEENKQLAVGSKQSIEIPKPTILKYLFFEKNSARILPESEDQLIMLADILMAAEGTMVEISGHTDESGTEDGNQKLSLSRAQAVVNFMVMLDIAPERMTYKGYGSSRPLADNKTEEGRNKNRRVEFMLRAK